MCAKGLFYLMRTIQLTQNPCNSNIFNTCIPVHGRWRAGKRGQNEPTTYVCDAIVSGSPLSRATVQPLHGCTQRKLCAVITWLIFRVGCCRFFVLRFGASFCDAFVCFAQIQCAFVRSHLSVRILNDDDVNYVFLMSEFSQNYCHRILATVSRRWERKFNDV